MLLYMYTCKCGVAIIVITDCTLFGYAHKRQLAKKYHLLSVIMSWFGCVRPICIIVKSVHNVAS